LRHSYIGKVLVYKLGLTSHVLQTDENLKRSDKIISSHEDK